MDAQQLHDLYRTGLWIQVGVCATAGVWAGAAHLVTSLRVRAMWVFTVVAYLVVTADVVMASILVARYDWEFPELHMLYEFSGIVAIGIIYSYGQQMKSRRYLIYGGGGLFLMGLALRSLFMS